MTNSTTTKTPVDKNIVKNVSRKSTELIYQAFSKSLGKFLYYKVWAKTLYFRYIIIYWEVYWVSLGMGTEELSDGKVFQTLHKRFLDEDRVLIWNVSNKDLDSGRKKYEWQHCM